MTDFCGFTPKNRFFLAPMAGITDAAFRTVCAEQGAAVTYTEMVSAKALVYDDRKTALIKFLLISQQKGEINNEKEEE